MNIPTQKLLHITFNLKNEILSRLYILIQTVPGLLDPHPFVIMPYAYDGDPTIDLFKWWNKDLGYDAQRL